MTALPTPGVVSQLLTVRLLAPGRPSDLEADFWYDVVEPYGVRITFHSEAVPLRPELDRSSLARGVMEPVGGGRVSMWPSLTVDGRAVVVMSVSGPEGDLVCEVSTEQLHRFLARTYTLVPAGTESDHLDLDAVVERLLTSDAQ
ncbi:SsgA family sporulation/cell division regulator [Nocardioides sp.]|uniref:SsgA family sporulation/cell division regulator n=1 Tax=Nocardioides sp. TaxID=35761 RepID=UPI002ED365D8